MTLLPRLRQTIAGRPQHARNDEGCGGALAGEGGALPSPWSPTRWHGNVVPFARPIASGRLETIQVDRELRLSSPRPRLRERYWLLCMLAASAAMHATAFFVFDRAPPPLASVGVESMSVEIVLGSNAAAGFATKPTQSEASVDAAAATGKTAEVVKAETAREAAEVRDQATPIAPDPIAMDASAVPAETKPMRQVADLQRSAAETAAQAVPPAAAVTAPPLLASENLHAVAEAAATATAAEVRPESAKPKVVTASPKPKPTDTTSSPKRRGEPRRAGSKQGKDARTREGRASVASVASSGIGRGRSDADSNYRGIVAAQLARHKNFPPDARRNGDHGSAVVSFGIDGDGRVTAVTLVRATGFASLDREAQAMVRRASPFPPPPARHAMRFTVPVSFDIR
jgi:TonB family protein